MQPLVRSTSFFPSAACYLLAIASLWGLSVLLVDYRGNFPLNDDWSYGIAVQRLVEEGTYAPTAWTSMSLLSQVLWGSLFCYLFGFSFEVLRCSTLVMSLLTLFTVFLVIRQLNPSKKIALLASLLVAFNPIYFALSYTFMTDIPFLGFTTASLLFFLRYLARQSVPTLIFATAFATAAVLCRQTGLYLPIAFGLTYLHKRGFKPKALIPTLLPGAVGLGALLGYKYWLDLTGKTPELYGKQIQSLIEAVVNPAQWPVVFAENILIAIMYLGLFLSPFLLLLLLADPTSPRVKQFRKWFIKTIVPVSILIGMLVFSAGKLMPLGNNVMAQEGVGPLTLYDTYTLGLTNAIALPETFWGIVTVISMLGAATLLIYLFSTLRCAYLAFTERQRDDHHYALFFMLTGGVVYFLPILFLGYYDRYLLTPLLLVAFIICLDQFSVSMPRALPGVLLLLLFAFYSVASTHDYLSWNRARWRALQHAQPESLPYYKVNGGFEYNGLALYRDASLRTKKASKWWSTEDDVYVITFGRVDGYKVVQTYEYNRWLPPTSGQIFLLKR